MQYMCVCLWIKLHPLKLVRFFYDCVQILTQERSRVVELERRTTVSHCAELAMDLS